VAHEHGGGNGRLCQTLGSPMNLTKYFGNGLRMVSTPLNQPTEHTSMGLFAHSMPLLFGKLKLRGSTSFFAWLLVQSKILTADKLMARNWPCNLVCALCDQEPETANHLILHCSFAREVWHRVSSWSGELLLQPSIGMSLEDWWNDSLAGLSKEDRRSKAAILIYSAWNIWKARNRQVFYHTLLTPPQVLLEIKKEIALRKRARGEESS